jgi:hypothetical protein
MSADLTKREVCKQSQQQLKTPMIPGDETILIPIVANFFATGGLSYPRYLAAVISRKNLFAQATDGKGLAIESSRHFAVSRIQFGAARSKGTFQDLLLELFNWHVGRTLNRRRGE